MRINHNIQALNAYRQLSQNQGVVSKHLERLSSGLRINRAADDAAGLAISEKMRSQIRGLAMAERNTMDGISLIQTAEGALGTTHEILQRMRELSVQAANGTLAEKDRAAIQNEIDQLTKEIDRIAKTTQFNGKQLLRGSEAGRAFASNDTLEYTNANNGTWRGMVTADSTSKAAVELNLGVDFGKIDAASADAITFTINGKTYELDVAGSGSEGIVTSGNIAVNITGWSNGGTDADAMNNVNAVLDALKSAIMANDPTFDSAASTVTHASDAAQDGVFDANGTLVLKTVKNMTPEEAAGVSVSTSAGGANFYEAGTTTPAGNLVGDKDATASKSISISFAEAPKAGDHLKIDNVTINFGTPAALYDSATNTITIDVTNKSAADVLAEVNNLLTTISADPTEKADALPSLASSNISGNNLVLTTNKTDDGKVFGDPTSNGLEIEIFDADFVANAGAELKLNMQVGANAKENMEISFGVMDAAALGLARAADHKTPITTPGADAVAGIDVTSSEDAAQVAISLIDNAIKMVSEERSKMGAYQNRMEHTITNLSTANENLTAAESRIRDADMAMEMTNFTKNNIINQAATAMLAQANQLPQGILQLLK
ncbi:flagellin [Brevibacillus borstelensis]|jgi:flagellin|uniref:flagellin N-terminal helical domain-containing protein n=1 Tax=Brevibacillus borstelensis TaxID=45462 RepID=UPI002E1E03B4|nr:flagellin [Brevibacillus borstelensis]MED1872986.1 flagellin [Brevibacillus borstelensis]